MAGKSLPKRNIPDPEEELLQAVRSLAARLPSKKERQAWLDAISPPPAPPKSLRAWLSRAGSFTDWLSIALTIALSIAGTLVAFEIFNKGEALTAASPVLATQSMHGVIDVAGIPDDAPRVSIKGVVVHMRIYNKGRTDTEVAAVNLEGADGLFYTATSCGERWVETAEDGTKIPHTIGKPFVLEAGRSELVVIYVPGATLDNRARLQLADGREIKATRQREQDGTETSTGYEPGYQQIEQRCDVPGSRTPATSTKRP